MATGQKIVLRTITNPEALVDMQWIGELYYDTTGNRLCICNGPDVIPYPSIDLSQSKTVIPKGFELTGYTNNHMRVSWATANSMNFYNKSTGISIMNVRTTQQTVRLAMDAVYNRTGPQSLEVFSTSNEDQTFTLSPSNTLKRFKTGGNLWVEQYTNRGHVKNITVSPQNHSGDTHLRGVRNKNIEDYSPHLFSRGRLSLLVTSKSPLMTGLTVKSVMYYPGAGRNDLTFFLLYSCVARPVHFATRIGWSGNYQTYVSEIVSRTPQHGALAFQFRADKVLPQNRDKPINIDWLFDLICATTPGVSAARGIHLSGFMVVPGLVSANSINPSFPELATDYTQLMMYGTDGRTEYMMGRETGYVNFEVPMISSNYTIDILSSVYSVEITKKTRFGFICRSTQAPIGTAWKFTYAARL